MLLPISLVVASLLAVVLVLALRKPDTFRVQRTARIDAEPGTVYALVSSFHRWGEWSPWEKLDPEMQRNFSGADAGSGAVYAWDGKGAAGAGRMEITGATPPTGLVIQLDFVRPFASRNRTEFAFVPEGRSTTVVWTMEGPSLFITKLMQVFVNMDAMIGKDFEAGLAAMKAVAERAPASAL